MIAPPIPTQLERPASAADAAPSDVHTLYVTADGTAHFAGLTGPLALDALAMVSAKTLTLHVDANLPAAEFAPLLRQLGAWGIASIEIVTEARE